MTSFIEIGLFWHIVLPGLFLVSSSYIASYILNSRFWHSKTMISTGLASHWYFEERQFSVYMLRYKINSFDSSSKKFLDRTGVCALIDMHLRKAIYPCLSRCREERRSLSLSLLLLFPKGILCKIMCGIFKFTVMILEPVIYPLFLL